MLPLSALRDCMGPDIFACCLKWHPYILCCRLILSRHAQSVKIVRLYAKFLEYVSDQQLDV